MQKTVGTVGTVNFRKMGNLIKNSGDSGDRAFFAAWVQGVPTQVGTASGPIYLCNLGKLGLSPLFSNTYTYYRKKNISDLLFCVFYMWENRWGQWGQWGHPLKPSYITIVCPHCWPHLTLSNGAGGKWLNVK